MNDSVWMQIITVIWDEIARMWWFFLLSIVLVGLIKGFKLDLRIRDAINRAGSYGILIAIVVGMVSPLCACGILPVAISLAMIGTPLAPLLALLATSPIMGPDALLLTWSGLGADWAILKVVGAAIVGLSVGLATEFLVRSGYLAGDLLRLKPVYREDGTLASAAEIGDAAGIHVKSMSIQMRSNRLRFIFDRTLDAGLFVGKFLLLAIVLEAILVTLVPMQWITVLVGDKSVVSVILAALIGLPLPINQIPAIPILSGLLQRGIDPGAAWTFLLAAPVTSLPAMIALTGMFRLRVVVIFLTTTLLSSILLGWVFQLIF
jgi:uncharacterized membrane protein YraQ (UPF0718 family)